MLGLLGGGVVVVMVGLIPSAVVECEGEDVAQLTHLAARPVARAKRAHRRETEEERGMVSGGAVGGECAERRRKKVRGENELHTGEGENVWTPEASKIASLQVLLKLVQHL